MRPGFAAPWMARAPPRPRLVRLRPVWRRAFRGRLPRPARRSSRGPRWPCRRCPCRPAHSAIDRLAPPSANPASTPNSVFSEIMRCWVELTCDGVTRAIGATGAVDLTLTPPATCVSGVGALGALTEILVTATIGLSIPLIGLTCQGGVFSIQASCRGQAQARSSPRMLVKTLTTVTNCRLSAARRRLAGATGWRASVRRRRLSSPFSSSGRRRSRNWRRRSARRHCLRARRSAGGFFRPPRRRRRRCSAASRQAWTFSARRISLRAPWRPRPAIRARW